MRILYFIAFILSNSLLFSQKASIGDALSLEECLKIANKKNFDIAITNYQMKSAGAEVTRAFGSYLPSVNFNSNYTRNETARPFYDKDGKLTVSKDSYTMNAGASLNIFDGFKREYQYSSAANNFDAAVLTKEQTIADVNLNVYKLYIAVVFNYQSIKIQQENLDQGKVELDRIESLYKAGSIAIGDIYAQESDLGTREINLINSIRDLAVSKSNLLNYIGLSPTLNVEFLESSLPIEISDTDIEKFNTEISLFRNQLDKALEYRADFEASKLSIESAENSISFAKAGYYPTISASAGWSFYNYTIENIGDNSGSNFRVSMNLPVFQNFTVNSNVQSSKLSHLQSQVNHERLKQNILTSINTLFLNLDSYQKQIAISKKSLQSAEQNYASAKSRFENGTASITDVIQANTLLLTSKIDKINSTYSYIQTQKEILHGVGKLD